MTPTPARLARLLPPTPDARPDGALLAAFLADRDEAAFAELVRRHGPLVLAACRRLLPDPADAADAFQASFLVLVRRARRLTGAATLGPWLYRVAAWTARNVRRRNARRLARTAALTDAVPAPPISPVPTLDLDAALLALPEKYRVPLVLCHLQGWSRRDAAARLGYPEGTLSSLLARGLVKLKARLRGYDPAAVLTVGLTAVPAGLTASTVSAATATRAAADGLVPPSVAELTEGVLRMFWVQKATAAAAGLAMVFALGAGVGLSVREAPGVTAQVPTAPPPRAATGTAVPDPDPLEREIAALEQERARLAVHERNTLLWKKHLEPYKRDWEEARDRLNALPAGTPPDRRVDAEVDETRARARLKDIEKQARAAVAEEVVTRGRVETMQQSLKRHAIPEVSGTLAVDVTFPDTTRYRIAMAAVRLAGSATAAGPAPATAWATARRGAHVLVLFPEGHRPRFPVQGGADVTAGELLVPLPLTRDPGGFVLVRDGDRVVRFSNYPSAAAARFQEALSAGVPAVR